MKREDEIMAEYLLKGGKMLSASCLVCGCPLFEVKGETYCVVCAEGNKEPGSARQTGRTGMAVSAATTGPTPATAAAVAFSRLAEALEETLIALCIRIRGEEDPRCVAALMEAVARGIESLETLRMPKP